MSLPITEVVVLTLQPGPGFQRSHWGKWVEETDKVQLLIDWDNIKAHQAFEKSGADYAAVGALLGPVLAAAPAMHHANFSPKLSDELISTNVTELATFHGLSSTFSFNLGIFLNVLRQASGFKGVSGGVVVEDLEFKGKKEAAYMIAISWESVDHHEKAMATEEVMESLPLIGGAAEHRLATGIRSRLSLPSRNGAYLVIVVPRNRIFEPGTELRSISRDTAHE